MIAFIKPYHRFYLPPLGGILILLLTQFAPAYCEKIVFTPVMAHIYQGVGEIESQVYGHAYPDQELFQRVDRLERTLFGNIQPGSIDTRYQRLQIRMNQAHQAGTDNNPMLEYLEQKLFQQAYPNQPLNQRLEQLESHVFGKTFEQYPADIRLQKLTYTIPIMTKGIRISTQEMVVASATKTHQHSQEQYQKQIPERTPISTSRGGRIVPAKRSTPSGLLISTGDYFHDVFKTPYGQILRWQHLPVKVFISSRADAQARELTQKGLQIWGRQFSCELTEAANQADILIRWDAQYTGPITQPIVQLDAQKNLRTVLSVNMASFSHLSQAEQFHALLHQLGHAFGIFAHSQDPNDIMFPRLHKEANDIPPQWLRRSTTPSDLTPRTPLTLEKLGPSQRDINTLTKIYSYSAATPLEQYTAH